VTELTLPRSAPLAGFPVLFGWGVRRLFRTKKFLVTTLLAVGIGAGLALLTRQEPTNSQLAFWKTLDDAFLGVAVPLVALALVGGGYGEEVQDRTLVWHLVRPVSRTTFYVARYASGIVPGAFTAAAMVLAATAVSPLSDLSGTGYAVVAGLAVLGTATIGALYYALAAIFRRGLIAGLLYSFLFEGFFQFLPGAFQSLSLMHHVRSLYHRALDDEFAGLSRSIADEIRSTGHSFPGHGASSGIMAPAAVEPWTTTPAALAICAAVIAVSLFLGARVVSNKDYALKD
jgi:ABC-type transport system involved in multi-copper enzyme maturation permease subunit